MITRRLLALTRPITVVSAGGAELFVTYTCPQGDAVCIVSGSGQHNDVARNCWWELDTGAGFGITGSDLGQIEFGITSTMLHQLYSVMIQRLPLFLRAGQRLRWNLDVKTGGKILTMRLIVDEYHGETPYAA